MGVKDHALFDPPSDGGKARDIHFVIVQRMQGGTWITSPVPHTHDDFPSLQALQAAYGGGKYRLLARDALNARITARKDWDLPGPPLPFPGEAPATPTIAAVPAPHGGGEQSLIAMMMQMQQTAAQQSDARMMQFMQMMSQQQAQTTQAMMGIVTALVQQKPVDNSQSMLDALRLGIDLGGTAKESDGGGGDGDDILESLAKPLMQGAMQAAMEKPEAPPTKPEGGQKPAGEGSSGGGQ